MLTWLNKQTTIISLVLIVILLVTAWLFPENARIVSIIFVIFIFAVTSIVIFHKHRETYVQGKISRAVFLRKVGLDVTGILLAMMLAALVGNYIASLATQQIVDRLARFVTTVFIAFLVGISLGLYVKKSWDNILQPQEKESN